MGAIVSLVTQAMPAGQEEGLHREGIFTAYDSGMAGEHRYWFPAKRFGWGWGLPTTWQGYLVLGVYFGLIGVGMFAWSASRDSLTFFLWTMLLTALLIAVCWWKGEPPGGRRHS
jgi:hypothetical protein